MTTAHTATPASKHAPVVDRAHPNHGSGTQRIYRFENGYGASVIQSRYSYGGESGLFELAVVKFNGPDHDNFTLTYDTPITSDVIGHLTDDAVEATLTQIQALAGAA